ncbi:MAG: ribonuclease P protein component [Pseudomonadota bacterium]
MKKRAAFLNAARGVFLVRPGFVLQRNYKSIDSKDGSDPAEIGYTVTKKVGNAVVRNRVKRRLKEAVRHLDPALFEPGYDYVLIGRHNTLTLAFKVLCTDMESALKKLSRGGGRPARPDTRQKRR